MLTYTVTAGHDPVKRGATADGLHEHELMADLRNIVTLKLEALGHTVRTDGRGLANLPLPHAITLIPGSRAAIELHTNSHDNRSATGVEVLSLPQHKELARTIARRIAHVLELPVRGEGGWVPQSVSPHGSLGFVRMGGMVVEVFFLSNQTDRARYLERKWLVASAIVQALIECTAPSRAVPA
jgi:N-acetylmuramoyl-L-alanine amidase